MLEKKAILLKDTPTQEAGTIFTKDSRNILFISFDEQDMYNESVVENNPEWFNIIEVKEDWELAYMEWDESLINDLRDNMIAQWVQDLKYEAFKTGWNKAKSQ